jgi:hypothetical protein
MNVLLGGVTFTHKEQSMAKQTANHFLRLRGASLIDFGHNYNEVAKVCDELGVVARSGDLMSQKEWEGYCGCVERRHRPRDKAGSLVFMYRDETTPPGKTHVVAVGRVHDDGLFVSTLLGGNNDMSPGEFQETLKQVITAIKGGEISPYAWGTTV